MAMSPDDFPTARPVQLNMAPNEPALAPVSEGDRIGGVDVLRGVAILGILLVNMAYYGLPFTEVEQLRWWSLPSSLEGAIFFFVDAFCTMKFITLFSLLFGMGLGMQSERARIRQRPFAWLYSRRLLFLLAFGIAHGTLLWYGDILTAYALIGFIALLMRNLRVKTLMIVASILFLLPPAGFQAIAMIYPESLVSDESFMDLAKTVEDEDVAAFLRFLDDDVGTYQEGSFGDMFMHRTTIFAIVTIKMNMMMLGARTLALFLVGIAIVRSGLLTGHRPGIFRWLARYGIPIGLVIEGIGYFLQYRDWDQPAGIIGYVQAIYFGSIFLSLAYMAIILRACQSKAAQRMRRFGAVGQMALTNYLSHSIICSIIFYSYGFAEFAKLRYGIVMVIGAAIFVTQLWISPWWLSRFRFGPFEWLWRSLTYWERQPMVKPTAHVVPTATPP